MAKYNLPIKLVSIPPENLPLSSLESGIPQEKNGGNINIKASNRGKFTEYCNGKVTNECINRGLNSDDETIRKRALFAKNSRRWKHK